MAHSLRQCLVIANNIIELNLLVVKEGNVLNIASHMAVKASVNVVKDETLSSSHTFPSFFERSGIGSARSTAFSAFNLWKSFRLSRANSSMPLAISRFTCDLRAHFKFNE